MTNESPNTKDWHAGEARMQRAAGLANGSPLRAMIKSTMPAVARDFVNLQRLAALATVDAQGAPWASILFGPAGFLSAPNASEIVIDSAALDETARSNLAHTGDCGLIVIEPATRRRVRVNGRARIGSDGLLRLRPSEVYSNCPKYIRVRTPLEVGAGPELARLTTRARQLSPQQRARILSADTFFIASRHPEAGADASHRGGAPGFVHVASESELSFPDYSGNGMFQTLGNLCVDERVSLIFPDFDRGRALRLTGRARIDDSAPTIADFAGAERVVHARIDEVHELEYGPSFRWSPS